MHAIPVPNGTFNIDAHHTSDPVAGSGEMLSGIELVNMSLHLYESLAAWESVVSFWTMTKHLVHTGGQNQMARWLGVSFFFLGKSCART